jgi:hypothetical protein
MSKINPVVSQFDFSSTSGRNGYASLMQGNKPLCQLDTREETAMPVTHAQTDWHQNDRQRNGVTGRRPHLCNIPYPHSQQTPYLKIILITQPR